ncbi:MAG TPA: sulfatase-like hydrolase/transferase [Phycisphaerae bacterium]|nr:sulfatase-like hydrolase/transferase [Phycisphaerae bacterium]
MKQPNIIVILADDLSYWDISHFGQKEFSTPNIDRMAREGMVFSNAYASSPECAPSRAGLLTGQHMGHCTFRRLGTDVRPELHQRPYLLPEDETIAHVLGAAGYTTCQIGKWHAGEPGTPGMPHLQGFEHSLCFDHGDNSRDKRAQYIYPTRLWRNGVRTDVPDNLGFEIDHADHHFDEEGKFVPGGISDASKARYCEDIYLQEALDFLRRPHEKPFFLYYASSLTHAEWPKELRELKDKPAPWTDDQKRWAGQVKHMDRSVGAILDELKGQGMDENTLVVFTSDNGYAAWGYSHPPRGRWEDDPVLKNKGPWDRGKFIAANGGMIVPFIAWGPGLVKAGQTGRAVAHYDLKAMFAEMAGATAANEMDGVSFAPLLAGEESRYPPREFFYWEQGGLGLNVQSALLDERYFALRMEPSQPTQLFDIFADPGCKQDLAEDHPGQIERAQTLFISQHDDNPWYVNLTDALREHKSIGRNRRRTGEGHGHSC